MGEGDDQTAIFKGAYNYFEGTRVYSEENFQVYKHQVNHSLTYESEILTRVANGEFLKIKVLYRINKEFIPISVVIDKTLGSQHVQEMFIVDSKGHSLTYAFATDNETVEEEIGLPPKFYIATPSAATCFLYFMTKKFDQASKNYYSILTCDNMWEFNELPKQERIFLESPNTAQMAIKVDDKNLNCNHYNMYEENDEKKLNPVGLYISRHIAIPYRVQDSQGTKIEIRYLNNLERDKVQVL